MSLLIATSGHWTKEAANITIPLVTLVRVARIRQCGGWPVYSEPEFNRSKDTLFPERNSRFVIVPRQHKWDSVA